MGHRWFSVPVHWNFTEQRLHERITPVGICCAMQLASKAWHILLGACQAFMHNHRCEGASKDMETRLWMGSIWVPTSTGMPVSLASSPKTPVLRDLENLPPS